MGNLQSGTIQPAMVRKTIDEAAKNYHVLGAMSFGDIPEGHSVCLNVIQANADPKAGDVYDVGMGKFGLTGNLLNALADAAGVSVVSSNMPIYETNYCVCDVTVARMGLDGRVRRMLARKVMDLRPGSGQRKAMEAAAKGKNKDAAAQIREQQLRLPEHADSKARLRAIRALLSVRTYTKDELARPFAVFTLQLTGRTNDPELKHMYAFYMMQASLGAIGMLYGNAMPAAPAFQMTGGAVGGGPPMLPTVSGRSQMVDVGDGVPDDDDLPPTAPKPTRPAAAPRAGDPTKVFMPGKKPTPSIANAEDKDLVYWEKRMRGDVGSEKWEADPYREKNTIQLVTIRAELLARGLAVEPHAALDPQQPAAPAQQQAPQQSAKPPSGRGQSGPPVDENPFDDEDPTGGYGHRNPEDM